MGCIECSDKNTCTQCDSSIYLRIQGNKCTTCGVSCLTCDTLNTSSCLSCENESHFLYNN